MSWPTSARRVSERPAMSISYRESFLANRAVLRCGLSDNFLSSNVRTFQMQLSCQRRWKTDLYACHFLIIFLPLNEQSASRGYWPYFEAKDLFGTPFQIHARRQQCFPKKAALKPLTPPSHVFRLD